MHRLVLLLFAVLAAAIPLAAVASPGGGGSNVGRELAQVRQATAKYHNVRAAIADGYQPTDECVESPAGGMGFHYVNPALMGDPALDPRRPEVLLYAPSGNGVKLVGVEWIKLFSHDPNAVPPSGTPLPALFGQTFEGWMPGHFPGMPWHAELHAWVWQANPKGVFAPFNPNVDC